MSRLKVTRNDFAKSPANNNQFLKINIGEKRSIDTSKIYICNFQFFETPFPLFSLLGKVIHGSGE